VCTCACAYSCPVLFLFSSVPPPHTPSCFNAGMLHSIAPSAKREGGGGAHPSEKRRGRQNMQCEPCTLCVFVKVVRQRALVSLVLGFWMARIQPEWIPVARVFLPPPPPSGLLSHFHHHIPTHPFSGLNFCCSVMVEHPCTLLPSRGGWKWRRFSSMLGRWSTQKIT
jgi:hypothetical protein